MFQFSIPTLALLHQAGWSEDYRYDTTEWESLLKGAGYTIHTVALDFMQRFGGLVITYPHPYALNATEELKFTVSYGIGNTGKDRARHASRYISELWRGVEGCDIGTFNTDDFRLMMDASGVVYGYGDVDFRVGDSGEEAIEHICSRNYGEDLAPRYAALMNAPQVPTGYWFNPDDLARRFKPNA